MKISLNWLKDYVSVNIPAEQLSQKLTMSGLEVEKISSIGGDTVFELEITPNRPDCLNMWGMAREVSAILNKTPKWPQAGRMVFPRNKCDIKVLDRQGCGRYIGCLIENVHVTDAPDWIQKRIAALGMRPINNVVDITNFCLMETGQPLHAFDYDKLAGGKIMVRRAKEGETIVTIDGVERKLDSSVLVIADAERPVAIAGIMGGKETEVTEYTRNILLESAFFDSLLIRRASRGFGLTSDSSYRFERGVDYEMVKRGAQRAVSLLIQHAGGHVRKYSDVTAAPRKISSRTIVISKDKINSCLGSDLTTARCRQILQRLDFRVLGSTKDILKVIPPSFRADVKADVDIIEEIARIVGYDGLPSSLPVIKAADIKTSAPYQMRKIIQNLLAAQGFLEAITYTMIPSKNLDQVRQGDFPRIKIRNPLTQDQEILRPSMLSSLLITALFNLNRGQRNLRIFETGNIYTPEGEKEVLALIMTGARHQDWRQDQKTDLDYYDIKGVVEQTFERLGVRDMRFEVSDQPYFQKGQGVAVKMGELPCGVAGKIDGELLEILGIKKRNIFFAQIETGRFAREIFEKKRRYMPLSEYPAITRDVSLAVRTTIDFQELRRIAVSLGKDLLTSIVFNEEYLGEKIPEGYRGMIFSLNYQSRERTLREEEVNAIHNQILQGFVSEIGAIVR